MKQIALYGKGGIGKSTAATHLSYAIADQGKTVLQVGCDPQADSTANLLDKFPKPILDVLAEHDFEYEDIEVDDILIQSKLPFANGGSVFCTEAGGPEPGVGCGGKGVIEAIKTLEQLEVFDQVKPDLVIYDILGDVVCGGFSQPIRDGFAEDVYIVTSGELEALYQAVNVMGAIRRFSTRSGAQLGGLIVNLRGIENEQQMVTEFAEQLDTRVIAVNPFSQLIKECSGAAKTVFEEHSDSPEAEKYRQLAATIMGDTQEHPVPGTMTFEELYEWWSGHVN